jgi:hypothetical protein
VGLTHQNDPISDHNRYNLSNHIATREAASLVRLQALLTG